MPKQKNIFLYIILIFSAEPLTAQNVLAGFESNNNIPVFQNGVQLQMPWVGGFNSPQFSLLDVNLNGQKDLVVFDRSNDKTSIFLRQTDEGGLSFQYSDGLNQYLPNLSNWALFRDYNCDGQLDIFTHTLGGIRVFKNTSNSLLNFTETYPLLSTFINFGGSNQFSQNLYVERVDIPLIEDFDGNGKLDIITYSLMGTRAEYHKNLSENCEELSFELRNLCFGYFSESDLDNNLNLNLPACTFNVLNPSLQKPNEFVVNNRDERHVGSTISALDLNNDGKKELFIGDVNYFGISALINSISISGRDSFPSQINNWPTQSPINIPNFPATYFLDVDNDGNTDLIAAPNDRNASENIESAWYYRNTGSNQNPNFTLITTNFLQNEMIDIGEDAKPSFFDYNQDGLQDLIIGGRGIFQVDNAYLSKLSLYENTGTSTNPAFTLVTDDYLNLSATESQNLSPSFGDLNGDGKPDLIIAELFGQLRLYYDLAPAGQTANFELISENILSNLNEPVTGGQYSSPFIFDLDNDGLNDLLIGNRSGFIRYYRNIGNSSSPVFTLITNNLGGVDVREPNNIAGTCMPYFFRNNINETLLLAGSESGKLYLYNNIDNNLSGDFSLVSNFAFNIKDGTRSYPYLNDINNDGVLDLFLGNRGGGIRYFEGSTTVNISELKKEYFSISLFPNPSCSNLNIKLNMPFANLNSIAVDIIDLQGKTIKSAQYLPTSVDLLLDISNLTSGLYLVKISNENYSTTSKFIKGCK